MKKVAIVTQKMVFGGIEKALIEMLKRFPNEKYDVDLILMENGGELINDIPKNINTVVINKDLYKSKCNIIKKIFLYCRLKKEQDFSKQCELISKLLPFYKKTYDIAIAYHAPSTLPVFYTINNISAENKILWIHSDICKCKSNKNINNEYFSKYNKIYCVSKYCLNQLNKTFPNLSEKSSLFYNFINKQEIKDLSLQGEGYNDDFDGIRIATVGRLSEEKGQDLIPYIAKRLLKDNINIRWYIIGDGDFRGNIDNEIRKYNLEDKVFLLGKKYNPYPFIKNCDIYVQPSRFEGFCTTTMEAKILCKPVITTCVSGADEQFISDINGIITDIDRDSIYIEIKRLIENKSLRKKIEQNLLENDN